MGSLRFTTASVRIPSTGGTAYAAIKATGLATPVTVTGVTSWVTATLNSGQTMLQVTAGSNTGSSRTTSVRITATDTLGQTLYADLSVLQDAAEDGEIVPALSEVTVGEGGGNYSMPYTISGGTVTGIGVSASRIWISNPRVTSSNVTYIVQPNGTGAERQGVITISGLTNGHQTTATITINQQAGSTKAEIRTADYTTFAKTGGTNTITPVLVNCHGLSASTTSTWLTVSSDGIHATITAASNTGDERRAGLLLRATGTAGGNVAKTVTVVQARGNAQPVGIIQPGISVLQVPGDAVTGRFGVTYDYIDPDTRAVSCDQEWLTCSLSAGGQVAWQSGTYTGDTQRTATITISATGTDGKHVSASVPVIQMPAQEFARFPIWRDEYCVIPDIEGEYVYYRLTTDGTSLYDGRGYAFDGKVTIHLNDILSDRVIPVLNIGQNGIQEQGGICHFDMETSYDGTNYSVYKPYMTYYDWSYDNHDIYTDYFVSDPIDWKVDPRQKLVATMRNLTTNDMSFAVSTEGFYRSATVSNTFATAIAPVGQGGGTVQINTETPKYYRLADGCARYCLYYLNRKGGWDSFLFNMESTEHDEVTNSTYRREMPNTTMSHARVMYQKEAVKGWTLKSRYLNDKESKNFATNLLESTQAYLHDLDNGEIWPVYIDNGSVDYHDYRSNGHKLVRYDVDVILSQIRRVR